MTASYLEVSPGSGLKLAGNLYTEGANSVLDQRMILGLPSLPTYSLEPAASTNPNTINSHMVEIMAGSSLVVYVWRLFLYVGTLAGAAATVSLQIRRLTTAGTGGTAGSFQSFDTTDPPVGATHMILPTVKGTEGANVLNAQAHFLAAVPTAYVPGPGAFALLLFDWNSETLRTKPIRIPPGTANGICIKNTTNIATATCGVGAFISESSF